MVMISRMTRNQADSTDLTSSRWPALIRRSPFLSEARQSEMQGANSCAGIRGRRVVTSQAGSPSVEWLPSIIKEWSIMRFAPTARNMVAVIWLGAGVAIWVYIFSIIFGIG